MSMSIVSFTVDHALNCELCGSTREKYLKCLVQAQHEGHIERRKMLPQGGPKGAPRGDSYKNDGVLVSFRGQIFRLV